MYLNDTICCWITWMLFDRVQETIQWHVDGDHLLGSHRDFNDCCTLLCIADAYFRWDFMNTDSSVFPDTPIGLLLNSTHVTVNGRP